MKSETNFSTDLPEKLRRQFKVLERRLFVVDTIIALCGAISGLVLAYLLLFLGDRIGETAAGTRMLISLAGFGLGAYFVVYWLRYWVLQRRGTRKLAGLVQGRYRRLGDRLLGVVELSEGEEGAHNSSVALREAAIKQVSEEALRYDFKQVVATRKPKALFVAAVLLAGLVVLPASYTPKASRNALNRFIVPGAGPERFTFVETKDFEIAPAQSNDQSQAEVKLADGKVEGATLYVPQGEAFQLKVNLDIAPFWDRLDQSRKAASQWAHTFDKGVEQRMGLRMNLASGPVGLLPEPRAAHLSMGDHAERRMMVRMDGQDHVAFTLPGVDDKTSLGLRLGDEFAKLTVIPEPRPRLDNKWATITLPNYLGYGSRRQKVETSMISVLRGSKVTIEGRADRKLNKVRYQTSSRRDDETTDWAELEPSEQNFSSNLIEVEKVAGITFDWADQHNIHGRQPWSVKFDLVEDEKASIDCLTPALFNKQPRVDPGTGQYYTDPLAGMIGMLPTDTRKIIVDAADDYGLMDISVKWKVYPRGQATGPDAKPIMEGENSLKQAAGITAREAIELTSERKLRGETENPEGDILNPHKVKQLRGEFPFSPLAMGIPENTEVEFWAVARDYHWKESRRVSESFHHRFVVLTKADHAKLIQEQFKGKMDELRELIEGQENNIREGERLQQDLKNPEADPDGSEARKNQRKLGQQEAKQNELKEDLKELAEDIGKLAEEANRNSEMDNEAVRQMLEAMKAMQDIAGQEMSKAQQSLSQAQQQQQQQQQQKDLEEGLKNENDAAEKMRELAEKAAEQAEQMEARNLATRLRAIAGYEKQLGTNLITRIDKLAGRKPNELGLDLRNDLRNYANNQMLHANESRRLTEEIGRFFDRTQKAPYGEVAEDMKKNEPDADLEKNSDLIKRNITGKSIEGAALLAKQFKEWADKIDPQDDDGGGGGEGGGEGGNPDEDAMARFLELMRLYQAEKDLKNQTEALELFREKLRQIKEERKKDREKPKERER